MNNLNAEFLGGYPGIFIKIIIAITVVYAFIMIVNFFRDKFIKKENISQDPQITDLLSILNKLFVLAGFGFITGNILQFVINAASDSAIQRQIGGNWDHLTFGVILIFWGIGFKVAKKVINKDNHRSNPA